MSHFEDLLLAYTHVGADRNQIERSLWREFGVRGAVFVLDMSDFSLITQDKGIVYYLGMIQRMKKVVAPLIKRFSGHIVKFEADNCFAYFSEVSDAIKAGVSINLTVDQENQKYTDEYDIHVSCGIDFGNFLLINGNDFFGHPVNRASKLGEDLAEKGEILITQEACNEVEQYQTIKTESVNFSLSHITINAYRILYAEQ